MHSPAHADLGGRLLLVANVDLRRRVVPDQHHVEPGRPAVRVDESGHAPRDLAPHLRRDRLTVEDAAPSCRGGLARTGRGDHATRAHRVRGHRRRPRWRSRRQTRPREASGPDPCRKSGMVGVPVAGSRATPCPRPRSLRGRRRRIRSPCRRRQSSLQALPQSRRRVAGSPLSREITTAWAALPSRVTSSDVATMPSSSRSIATRFTSTASAATTTGSSVGKISPRPPPRRRARTSCSRERRRRA